MFSRRSVNEKVLHLRDFFISILSDGIRTGKACLPVGKGRETGVSRLTRRDKRVGAL